MHHDSRCRDGIPQTNPRGHADWSARCVRCRPHAPRRSQWSSPRSGVSNVCQYRSVAGLQRLRDDKRLSARYPPSYQSAFDTPASAARNRITRATADLNQSPPWIARRDSSSRSFAIRSANATNAFSAPSHAASGSRLKQHSIFARSVLVTTCRRGLAHTPGFRFRPHRRHLPRTPDLLFPPRIFLLLASPA